ncbi:ATP-binding protein [Methanoregula sp.]|uniref:ATP-binding protein n=1 Tax=Methanoregula sp. TaxID=2052170 RepID=UPI002604270D|nr:ATP-binding protein [Methanoregula sp.]MDD5143870.1 ATP-binding protein [Methanoregula sp.]
MISIFISSVQKEFSDERRSIREFIHSDPLLKQFFHTFLFEDLPAADHRPDEIYLDEVNRCTIYLGIYGKHYGPEDAEGLSPTEREFDRATEQCKHRLIFVHGTDDAGRHDKMSALINNAAGQVIRRRFTDVSDLKTQVYAALVQYLSENGLLRHKPFEESICTGASIDDISPEKIAWFLSVSKKERKFPLRAGTPTERVLSHLNLLDGSLPTHAAVLLFGKNSHSFLPAAEIKCLSFRGTKIEKPIPSYQIFIGTLFDQVDDAADFVLSKLDRRVFPRDETPASDTGYEIPVPAIHEALVNAVVHRDYTSKAAVQVMVFADRIEVWNPGVLPSDLTPDSLKVEHPSIPRNPLIAHPLYLTHYIEKAGTGTLDMITYCREAGLPEPGFEQRGGQFVVTLWRDWLTESTMMNLGLSERQMKAIRFVKEKGRITNTEYQKVTEILKREASRDLKELVDKGIFEKPGSVTGKGTYYTLSKGATKGPKGPQ